MPESYKNTGYHNCSTKSAIFTFRSGTRGLWTEATDESDSTPHSPRPPSFRSVAYRGLNGCRRTEIFPFRSSNTPNALSRRSHCNMFLDVIQFFIHTYIHRISYIRLLSLLPGALLMRLLFSVAVFLTLFVPSLTGLNISNSSLLLLSTSTSLQVTRVPLNETVYERVRHTIRSFRSITFRELQVRHNQRGTRNLITYLKP